MKEKGNGGSPGGAFSQNRSENYCRWIHEVTLIDDPFLAGPGNQGEAKFGPVRT